MTPKRIVLLVLLLLVLVVAALFWVVNADTRVDLLFRVPLVGAWHLVDGVSLPLLLLVTLAIGALPAALLAGFPSLTAGRTQRNLKRQVAALKEEVDDLKRSGRAAASAGRTGAPSASTAAPKSAPAKSGPVDDFDDLI